MKKTIEILNEYWSGKTVQLNTMTSLFNGDVRDCLYSDEQSVSWDFNLKLKFEPITVTVECVDYLISGLDGGIDYILKFKENPNLYHYLD
mgnify:CR=1 FL=1